MKKAFYLILLLSLCITVIGCTKIGEKSSYIVNNDLVSLKVKEVTKTKGILILENNTDDNYTYGASYFLEKEKDGVWYTLIPINDMNFISIGYDLEPKEIKEMELKWDYHYGKLSSGKYRIIKNIFLNGKNSTQSIDDVYISAEFIIK